ncbi:hypothetical protein [Winogradskyella sp. PG-2]|uniref:hypothetical protein n=1 Tax=Winogradskyella sp. PG-2 TaxID=754409 RepID=UPI0018D4894B|nr:hypothetical protein [Winogradskyella sp. PG-2]
MEFLKASVALSAISVLPYSCLNRFHSSRFKLGYQLFSIRDEMANDPVATLKILKKMGYQHFEHYGFKAEYGTYYGYKTSEFKNILNDLNLSITSGHYPFANYFNKPLDELSKYVDQCIQGALTMKSKYIVWPWIAPEDRNIDGFKKLSKKLNLMGEQIN